MSSSPRSRVIVPSATPMNTIGAAATVIVVTTVPSVEPNQMRASTIQAMGGTPSRTVRIGRATRMVAAE